MKLVRLFGVAALVIALLTAALLGRILYVEWTEYSAGRGGLAALELTRKALIVTERISAERGPMVGVLGDAEPPDPRKREAMRKARDASDAAMKSAQSDVQRRESPYGAEAAALLEKARVMLINARENTDVVADLPQAERGARVMKPVHQMFDVIPVTLEAAALLGREAQEIYPEFSDAVTGARMAMELRDDAGRLGSQFTAALTGKKPLGPQEVQDIQDLRARIDQLRILIEEPTRRRNADPRIVAAVETMERRYFGTGTNFIRGVERNSMLGADYGMDMAQFAARYVPEMKSIVELRDVLLQVAVEGAQERNELARRNMMVALGFGVFVLVLLMAGFLMLRARVVAPLQAATRALMDIAQGRLDTVLPTAPAGGDIGNMVHAVGVLKSAAVERLRLERELMASNQEVARQAAEMSDRAKFFNDMVDALPIALALRDTDGRYVFVNRTWERYFGALRDAVKGTRPADRLPAADARRIEEEDRRALSQGPGELLEASDLLLRGRRYTQTRAVMTDADGTVLGVLAASQDTTEKYRTEKALAMERQRQELVVRCTEAGSVEWDARTRRVAYSRRMNEMLGFPAEATSADWTFLDQVHADDREAIRDLLSYHMHAPMHGATERRSKTMEFRMVRADGTQIWVVAAGVVLAGEDGAPGIYVGSFMDVTDRHQASDAIERAREMAEDASRMKSAFLANMSHEIRTPLNAITGMAYLALQTNLDAQQRNYIGKVDAAARNLLGILNDILDFSKIETGQLAFERAPFRLEDVLAHVANLAVMKAQDKGLELLFDVATDVPTALVGDARRLGQVILHLVFNAIKFTARGEVTFSARLEGHEGDDVRLRFAVRDTGVGLSEEQRSRLFSAFAQADNSTTRRYGGTGLGLSISKRLVDMMDGEIGVDSQLGAGSSFHFTARFGLQGYQGELVANHPDVAGMRILAVDDNERAREIMTTMLTSLRFVPTVVASGQEALAELERAQREGEPYGLVLMDWMMPGMDGVETLRRIRGDTQLADTPAFIMVTAYSRDEVVQRAGDMRIETVLTKPVSPSTLLDSILNTLARSGTLRAKSRTVDAREAARGLRGAHLLLVEDNEVNRELAVGILQHAGLKVDVAHNGIQALEKLEGGTSYDGVLMDCQMPEMDGYEATQLIRQDPRNAHLPILAMTANAMPGDRERCLASGMNDHIPKPLDIAGLFATLRRWIVPRTEAVGPEQTSAAATADDGAAALLVEGLETEQALRRLGGDRSMLRRLLAHFVQGEAVAGGTPARIRTALDAADLTGAEREAHTLKGLAGNIGAMRLAALASDMQTAVAGGDAPAARTALGALEVELQEVIAHIDAALSPVPAA